MEKTLIDWFVLFCHTSTNINRKKQLENADYIPLPLLDFVVVLLLKGGAIYMIVVFK